VSDLGQLLFRYAPNGVQYKELGDLVDILDNLRKPVSRDKREHGDIPYYGANGVQGYVKDFLFDGTFLLMGEDGSVINPDHSPVLNWVSGKIWVNNHAHVLSERPKDALLRYVFYALQETDISSVVRGMPPKINQANMRAIRIPTPPIEVQREIVKILDTFGELDTQLKTELKSRRSQYQFYRSKLLSFTDSETARVSWKTLGEVARIRNGSDHKHLADGPYPLYGTGGVMRHVEQYSYNKPSVLIPRKGSLKNLFFMDQPFWTVDTLFYTEIDEGEVDPKFLFHWLSTQELEKLDVAGGVPSLTQTVLNKVSVPLPKLAVQRKIGDILDTFSSLLDDETWGLPAEIAARRQQYEYYRHKLLTFNESEVA